MGNGDENDKATVKDIKIAMLEITNDFKDHISTEIKDLRAETNSCFKDLPCSKHDEHIKKNRFLIWLLGTLVSLALGYGLFDAAKLFLGGL